MEMNRKDLKKMMHSFNCISSRIMRVSYDEYGMVLKKFVGYIEANEIIMEYIHMGKCEYDAKSDWDTVVTKQGYMFDFGPSEKEESFQIYSILKYISENVEHHAYSFLNIYGERKFQDNVKQFNDRVVYVLINNINNFLTGVGIDMGIDENVVWNVSGGQVNVASGNATINAVQNNGSTGKELEDIVKVILENLSGLGQEDAETIKDSVEMIREEMLKAEPKKRTISNGIKLLAPMISIANGIPTLGNNIQQLIDMASAFMAQLGV